MPSALEVIRARTRDLHTQLEARFDLERALASRPAYRDLLKKYLGLYRPFERMTATQPAEVGSLVGWRERSQVGCLEGDLRALGATAAEIEGALECQDLPGLNNLDSVLGAFYVLEGSALGGQIIYRQVESRLLLDKDSGAAFFYGEGAETGRAWRRFTTLLEERVSIPERAADVACAMFRSFERWLAPPAREEKSFDARVAHQPR